MSDDLLGGRYRLEAVVGRGGVATVWRAIDTRLDRLVAVKVLDAAAVSDPTAVERFDREARVVARLTDPHVVAVYDVGTDGNRHYLVMELVDGTSLAAVLTAGPLDPARAVAIAVQVCDALEAAHTNGVVHRDIKPGNILIDGKGTVKVCDFGIARLVGAAQPALTRADAAIGTGQYMAPEQVAGGPIDARTDLYALGCVLYVMLTGAAPFEGDAPLSIAWQQLHRAPDPVGSRRPDLPATLARLVDRLLAKDPDDRPDTAAQVRQVLAGITTPGGASAGGATAVDAFPASAVRGAAKVMPHTRTMPVIEDIDASDAPRSRVRSAWTAGAVLTVAAVVLAALVIGSPGHRPDQGPRQPAGPAPTAAAPPASTTATSQAVDRPIDPVSTMRDAVAAEAAAGRIDEKAAKEIDKKLDQLQDALAEGKDDKVADKARDAAQKLAELHREGKITDAGWRSLEPALDQLTADAPAGDGDDD